MCFPKVLAFILIYTKFHFSARFQETENFQGPEEETIDPEELRQYEDYDLNQVRAEIRRLNMEIDSHTQLTPIEVRKLIMKNEVCI